MTEHEALAARLAEVEARLSALEAGAGSAEPSGTGPSAAEPGAAGPAAAGPVPAAPGAVDPDPFWVLHGIKERVPSPGAVFYAGAVETAAGPVDWQIGYPTERLLDEDWTAFAGVLAALGHPVRLSILQAVVGGAGTVSELASGNGMGTTGQLYHHVHQLTAQGWLAAEGRGRYSVPPERLVPLLAALAIAHR